jgi:transcriptional regulator with XRE-family HTH domain
MKLHQNKLTFGQKFALLRQMSGRPEIETAHLFKKSPELYIRYETDFLYPTESMLRRAAKLYGLTYNELMQIGENKADNIGI